MRNGLILERAGKYFRDLEKVLLDLSAFQAKIRVEMDGLALEYRNEFGGSRLVLYPKKRPKKEHLRALYWGVFCRPPKEESRLFATLKKPRWTMHIAGGLTHSHIFQAGADIHRKAEFLEVDRRAGALNDAFHIVTGALQSVRATLEARRDRRAWECGDLDAQAPEVSLELLPPLQSALGAGWFMLLRMASAEVELLSLAERYRAEPAYPPLKLTFSCDLDHPYGRLWWKYHRGRIFSWEGGGPQENLTDRWMRKARIPSENRRLLAPHERERRRMVRVHKKYTNPLSRIRRRAGQAITQAEKLLALSRPQAFDPAGCALGRPHLAPSIEVSG
jgi:hypothetical protein